MKIKNSILLISFLITITTHSLSQDNFAEGTNMINFGVGLGNIYYTGFGTGYALTVSLDHGLKKVDEIQGTIGLGGIIGYQGASEKWSNSAGYYKYHWNNLILAPRVTYHTSLVNTDKYDLYGGVMLGIRIESATYTTNYGAPDLGNYGGVYPTAGVFVGGVWYFADNVGAFAEVGYDITFLKLGITLKTGVGKR